MKNPCERKKFALAHLKKVKLLANHLNVGTKFVLNQISLTYQYLKPFNCMIKKNQVWFKNVIYAIFLRIIWYICIIRIWH